MRKFIALGCFLALVAGCRVLDISDEQAAAIASMAGDAASGIVGVATGPVSPGAGAGIGAMVGLGVAAAVKMLLSALSKKKVVE
jgi:hypothetical protein